MRHQIFHFFEDYSTLYFSYTRRTSSAIKIRMRPHFCFSFEEDSPFHFTYEMLLSPANNTTQHRLSYSFEEESTFLFLLREDIKQTRCGIISFILSKKILRFVLVKRGSHPQQQNEKYITISVICRRILYALFQLRDETEQTQCGIISFILSKKTLRFTSVRRGSHSQQQNEEYITISVSCRRRLYALF